MPSKMITRRQKSAAEVEAAVASYAGKAQGALAEAFGRFLRPGETFPDLDLFQRLCQRALAERREELVRRDEDHLSELRDDPAARQRRDAAAQAVLAILVPIRDAFRAFFGPQGPATLLGLGGAMTRDPVVLARKGRRILDLFRSDSLELPAPRLSGLEIDVSGWVDDLEPPLIELESALRQVSRDRRRAETTLLAKQDAVTDHDASFGLVARFLEGLYRLGGLDEIASRVRPSSRRPGQTDAVAKGESEAGASQTEEAEPAEDSRKLAATEASKGFAA